MKRPVRVAAVAVVVVITAFGLLLALQDDDPVASGARLVGEPLPALEVETFDGETITNADLAGKTVVVNFWNSWCIPCRQEHPELVAFHEAHRDDSDLVMLGIVRDDTEAAARDYVEREGVEWTVVFDPGGKASLDFGTTGQPETYVAGPDGIVSGAVLGPTTASELEAMVTAARAAA